MKWGRGWAGARPQEPRQQSPASCSCSWLLAWPSPAQRTATQPGSQGPRDGKYDFSGVSCIKILNFCPIIKIKLGIRIVQVKVLKVLNDGEDVPAVGGEAVAVLAAILLTPPLWHLHLLASARHGAAERCGGGGGPRRALLCSQVYIYLGQAPAVTCLVPILLYCLNQLSITFTHLKSFQWTNCLSKLLSRSFQSISDSTKMITPIYWTHTGSTYISI